MLTERLDVVSLQVPRSFSTLYLYNAWIIPSTGNKINASSLIETRDEDVTTRNTNKEYLLTVQVSQLIRTIELLTHSENTNISCYKLLAASCRNATRFEGYMCSKEYPATASETWLKYKVLACGIKVSNSLRVRDITDMSLENTIPRSVDGEYWTCCRRCSIDVLVEFKIYLFFFGIGGDLDWKQNMTHGKCFKLYL